MGLTEQARAARSAYVKQWRRKNPEKLRQYMASYWERRAAKQTPEIKAMELHAQGYTQRQISEALGVSLGTVNNYLKDK